MTLKMNYIDQYGDAYPESIWAVVETNMCRTGKYGRIQFHGFKNQADWDAVKAGEPRRIIGEKAYPIAADEYSEWFAWNELDPEDRNPAERSYVYAMQKLEGAPPEEGEEDTRVSFFDGAESV